MMDPHPPSLSGPPARSTYDVPLMRLAFAALFVLLGLLAATQFSLKAMEHHEGWPHDTFLFKPMYRFSDLTNIVRNCRSNNPYIEAGGNYFPLSYWALHQMKDWRLQNVDIFYLCVCAAGWLLACLFGCLASLGSSPRAWAAGLLLFMTLQLSYPMLFGLDRGNLDVLVGLGCFVALVLLSVERPILAALVLAVPIALKGYPVALCALFPARGHLKAGLLACAGAVVLCVLSFSSFQGGLWVNAQGLVSGVSGFSNGYILGSAGMHYSADPYDGIRILHQFFNLPYSAEGLLAGYNLFAEGVFAACAAYTVFARAPFHRRVLAITLGMLFYPALLNDYKLVNLFPALFFMAVADEAWTRADFASFVLLLLLCVPKSYFYLYYDVSISCLISPLLLVRLLLGLALDSKGWKGVWQALRHPAGAWRMMLAGRPRLEAA